jgi:hypothetical protein
MANAHKIANPVCNFSVSIGMYSIDRLDKKSESFKSEGSDSLFGGDRQCLLRH